MRRCCCGTEADSVVVGRMKPAGLADSRKAHLLVPLELDSVAEVV